MTIRREGLLIQQSDTPPIDLLAFESFQDAHIVKTASYRQMTVTGERKNSALVALRNGEDVDLSAHDLDQQLLGERMSALKSWKRDLIADDAIDADIKQAYRVRANEDIAKIHMLESSRSGNMRHFRRWNEFIYGKPDELLYRAALDWVAHDAERLIANPDQKQPVTEAAQNVLDMLDGERGYRELLIPDDILFQAVREHQMQPGGYFDLLLDGVELPDKGHVTKALGNVALQHIIIYNLKSDYGLQVSESGDWSVNHAERMIEHPADYNLPIERFIGLPVGHEIGQHYLEYINGMRGDVRLLSSGLDRTEWGNEGTALIREMALYKTFADFAKTVRWREIMRRTIGIGYAQGVGQDEPRSSSDMYAFMNTIDTMYQTKLTPFDVDTTADKAHRKTGIFVLRALRGVDRAGVYLKDKVYLEGNVAAWQTLADKGPQALEDSTLGKYDISNPRHIQFLQSQGILPDNQ